MLPHHGSSATGGVIACGCLDPGAPDDVHLFHDLFAVIQPRGCRGVPGVPGAALLVTALRPTAPFVLLNASLGDEAELVARGCGCPLQAQGWSTHLHAIRSHEKLTAGGMTFLDADLVRILEEVLPHRFGGGPIDDQLVEDLGADGRSRRRPEWTPGGKILHLHSARRRE